MEPSAREFLVNLLETPSPSGYEQPVQQIVRQYVSGVADEILTDVHGNVIACKNPQASLRLMFAGHSDQIGLVVTHINENGFIYVQPIGGWDPQQLVGQRMSIWSAEEWVWMTGSVPRFSSQASDTGEAAFPRT